MKKALLFTLFILLVFTLALTACGNNTATTTQKGESENTVGNGSETATITTTTVPVSTTPSPFATAYDDAENYVKLPELSSLQVSLAPINKDVADHMTQVLGSVSRVIYTPLTAGATTILGDLVNIHYTGRPKDTSLKLSDKSMEGMTNVSKPAGYDLVLGSGSFIPGFEEQLIGKKAGDTVTVDVTFPESYHTEELCGVAVLFEVKINSVNRATVGEKNTLSLIVSYTLKNGDATSELSEFMKEHSVTLDLRDTAALFDEYFSQDAVRTALLGKTTYGETTVELTLPLDAAKTFGYETELKLSAKITVDQIITHPEVLGDADINYYTGGEYTTLESYTTYVTNYYKSYYAYNAISEKAEYTVNETVYNLLYKKYYDAKVNNMIGDISTMTEEELAENYTDEVKKSADEYAKENATAEYNDRMLLSYLAKKTNFVLTDEMYQNDLNDLFEYYMNYYYYQMILSGVTSLEAFEAYFGEDYLRVEFVSNHVFNLLADLVSYVD